MLDTGDESLDNTYFSDADKLSAVETLREIMNFNRMKAKEIITQIMVILKNPEKRDLCDGSKLAMMYKKFAECEDIVLDAAAKLAPYEAPKLQALEVKNEITHRYVLRAPEQAKDTQTWLGLVGEKALELTDYKHIASQILDEQDEDCDTEDDLNG